LEAEKAHYLAMNLFKALCALNPIRSFLHARFSEVDPALERSFCGLKFKNPVGLGAGFDKNALYLRELETMGFGFVEIGTVTPEPQAGNDKPRLFRLKKDQALINRMGFNNDGLAVIAERLKQWRERKSRWNNNQQPKSNFLIGGNIGKNKSTPNEDAWKDYLLCFTALHPYVDFFVVNVSSPNTPGLRALQEKDALQAILTRLQEENKQFDKPRPILLKIAPDLTFEEIDDVIDLALEIGLEGLVATNTTIDRSSLQTTTDAIGAGGLSGKPLQDKSDSIVQYIHQKTKGKLAMIGSGGIFTGQDAERKIAAGADLIELWTGFIYEGPFIVRNICKHLVKSNANQQTNKLNA
jgi:dihydroorotate dehydrogenase